MPDVTCLALPTECGENLLHMGEVDLQDLVVGKARVQMLLKEAVRRSVLQRGRQACTHAAHGVCQCMA